MLNLLYILVVLPVALLLWEAWVEVVLPRQAREALNRGDRATEMALLERVIHTPRLLPGESRGRARYRLAAMYMEASRYAEAAQELRMMLAGRPGQAAEVNIRRRLADCLEFMGDTAGALQERNRVEKALQSGRVTADRLLSQGAELLRVQRYAEACSALEQALELMPGLLVAERGRVMVRLACASFDAGEPARAVEWAERALEHPLEPKMVSLAHRMAGVGCSNLGWLDRAEAHYQQGLDAATAAGNQGEVGKNIVQLAYVQKLRGRLMEAMETCRQGSALITDTDYRVVQMVQMESLRHLGRFDEARAALVQAQQTTPHMTPALERRSQATIALAFSWLEADAGRPEQAWDHLQQAASVFKTDVKMNVSCEGTLAWILALLGRRDEAIRKAQEVEARAPQWMQSRRTAQGCFSMPGRAYFALGEFARSRDCWERYLTLNPDPVYLPMAYWYIGTCSLRLIEFERARAAYQQAVAPGIPTYYADRARQWLAESHV